MDPEIYAKVKEVAARELHVDDATITPDSNWFDDLGASLDVVEMFMECEDVFGISIPDDDVGECRTPAELATYITKKLGRTPSESVPQFANYPRPTPKKK